MFLLYSPDCSTVTTVSAPDFINGELVLYAGDTISLQLTVVTTEAYCLNKYTLNATPVDSGITLSNAGTNDELTTVMTITIDATTLTAS